MADGHQATESVPAGACPTEAPAPDSPSLFQSGVLTFQGESIALLKILISNHSIAHHVSGLQQDASLN